MNKHLPTHCPACECILHVKQLYCETCDTLVTGLYELPPLAKMSADDQQFIIDFMKFSGSLKLMAEHKGLSYPSVRNMLDEIIERLNALTK